MTYLLYILFLYYVKQIDSMKQIDYGVEPDIMPRDRQKRNRQKVFVISGFFSIHFTKTGPTNTVRYTGPGSSSCQGFLYLFKKGFWDLII